MRNMQLGCPTRSGTNRVVRPQLKIRIKDISFKIHYIITLLPRDCLVLHWSYIWAICTYKIRFMKYIHGPGVRWAFTGTHRKYHCRKCKDYLHIRLLENKLEGTQNVLFNQRFSINTFGRNVSLGPNTTLLVSSQWDRFVPNKQNVFVCLISCLTSTGNNRGHVGTVSYHNRSLQSLLGIHSFSFN